MTEPAQDGSLPLHDLFDRQALRHPDKVAVRDQHGELTYAQTAQQAEQLAALLRQSCPQPGARIGLHLRRGAQLIVAMLAVLRSGHTYVPLDPAYPARRLLFTAQDADLALVLSDQPLPAELTALPVLRLDAPAPPTAQTPAPARPVDPGTPAYVIYTSGSTGRPKGVPVPHRNVAALIRACEPRCETGPEDVWTLFHSYAFDFSVWEIWGALLSGATLVVVPPEVAASPQATLDLLAREGVTVFNVVPSVFRHLARTAPSRRTAVPSALRYVIFGGESIDVRDIRDWRAVLGRGTRFVNTYGITESTVFVTLRPLTDEELDREPDTTGQAAFASDLGEPLDGWQLRVVDEHGADIQPGRTGEILVSGAGIATGYLDMPQLTAERFPLLPDADGTIRRHYRSGDLARLLPDGTYCYAGRADDQVKVNGHRIELGEVEARLREAPGIRDLAVVCALSRLGEPQLTAFYTPADPSAADRAPTAQPPSPDQLRSHARLVLPAHMVPTRFVPLPELPINPSGKTDRRALADLDTTRPRR
ncbi:amino acid adenylation domain-containing protein [Streptantibioticus parmotrematis]|uniref:amino acid adenylation domain-containing protein n=1 Tax=Streptantibioticus parmotrematis TaxID=2873249 RepID=UPI0033C76548